MDATKQFWLPLDEKTVCLVERGAMRDVDVQKLLISIPGSLSAYYDVSKVRVLSTHSEPMDRIAGCISEDM